MHITFNMKKILITIYLTPGNLIANKNEITGIALNICCITGDVFPLLLNARVEITYIVRVVHNGSK